MKFYKIRQFDFTETNKKNPTYNISVISLKKKKKNYLGAPGWLSWLGIQLLILAQVMILGWWDGALSRALCSAQSACPSPSAPPPAGTQALFLK